MAAASPRVSLLRRFRLFGLFDHIRDIFFRQRFELLGGRGSRLLLAGAIAKQAMAGISREQC